MEMVVVQMSKNLFEHIINEWNECSPPEIHLKANEDYIIKEVKIQDDFFKGDSIHEALLKDSIKSYKKLKEYEFNKRNK